MTVHGKIGTFRFGGPAKLTTWVFQIAKNRGIDYHRASRAEPEHVEFREQIGAPSQPGDGAYAGRNAELLKWLTRELADLAEPDQWLLKWRAREIPYAQIGEWLGMTEGTSRVRHKRAMEKLLKAAKPDVSEGAAPQ